MNFNYDEMNKEYEKALKKKIYDLLDQFGENCKKFEEEYDEDNCMKTALYVGKVPEYHESEEKKEPSIYSSRYYKLDDEDKKMVDELAHETNCTWQQAVSDAILWYHDWRINQGIMNDIAKEIADCAPEVDCESDMVNHPAHYCIHNVETIKKIERFIDGLPSKEAHLIGSALKYFDRAGLKDDFEQDCNKGNNYLHRAVTGKWKHE